MHVVAGFESSVFLEIALAKLSENDVVQKDIVIIELGVPKKGKPQILDTMYSSNGIGFFDAAAAWGVVGATLGCIYGSILKPGPVLLGLAGAITGALIGFLIDYWLSKKKIYSKQKSKKMADMLIIIRCKTSSQIKDVTNICENNNAVFLGTHQ